jgi:hypothetical protein
MPRVVARAGEPRPVTDGDRRAVMKRPMLVAFVGDGGETDRKEFERT